MVKTIEIVRPSKMKAKSKTRDARFSNRGKIGIPELEGYYFGHSDERAGSRFNRVVEKLADYARIEYGMKMFYLISDGIEPEWEELELPTGREQNRSSLP